MADALLQDLRYAFRLLRRNKLFALTAVLSIALGIGADTTIFSVVNALMFASPAGVAEPGRLVDIAITRNGSGFNGSYPDYLDIRDRTTLFEGVYASQLGSTRLTLGDTADPREDLETVFASLVSDNYFTVLGARPAIGRFFDQQDNRVETGSPAVLSHRFWQRRFNSDPAIVGSTIRLNGALVTVTGIAAPGFHGMRAATADVWLPLKTLRQSAVLADRTSGWLVIGGRLERGTSRTRASAELASLADALEREYPVENRGKAFIAVGWSPIPGGTLVVAAFLTLLMAIVSLVLVVACGNVASMLLARAMARRQEIAVRIAIGAGRARLVRQLLTETLVLFGLGGAAGLLAARAGVGVVARVLPALPFPIDVSLAIDWRVALFAAAVALTSALLTGLLPALQATGIDLTSMFKDHSSGSRARSRLRQSFVIAQVAASIVVGVLAGLFGRALQRSSVDPGFDARGVELTTINPARAGYTEDTLPVLVRNLAERARALPRDRLGDGGELGPGRIRNGQFLHSRAWRDVSRRAAVRRHAVDRRRARVLRTLGIRLIAGRDLTAADTRGAEPVAIVNESLARRFWPGTNPLGQVFEEGNPGRANDVRQMRVVGVAADIKSSTLVDGAAEFVVYAPLQQARRWMTPTVSIVTRTSRGGSAAASVRALVLDTDRRIPIVATGTLDDSIGLGLMPQRVVAGLSSSLGVVGLILAAIGIYGVTAYTVARRTREIGIRVALGARASSIAAMVLRHGLLMVAAGTIIGVLVSAGIAAALSGFLFGVSPWDPGVFATVTLLMAAVSVIACAIPTRRALSIKAIEALRCD